MGKITFAHFMDMALYLPDLGYYASPTERISPAGDYYTSPNAHPAFAALLALQIEQMWLALDQPDPFTIVEVGGGKGLLARDLIAYTQHLSPGFCRALEYILLEHSRMPQEPPPRVRAYRADQWASSGMTGCILSNEFFDSLPVHRVVQHGGQLQEVYVTLDRGTFAEERGDPSTPDLEAYFQREGVSLTEGSQAEVNLEAPRWLGRMAQALERGYIITIDYGDTAQALFSPQRPQGTLMCYYKHTPSEDPYQHLGEQDITASVDFTALELVGKEVGLATLGLVSQAAFLGSLGLPVFLQGLSQLPMPQAERYANLFALRDLAQPNGLGSFRVLVQGKGVPGITLHGLASWPVPRPHWARVSQLPVPRLDSRHIPLLHARYPHLAWDPAMGLE